MTLALSGKSPKRQGVLVLAALMAVLFAALGGVAIYKLVFADSGNPTTITHTVNGSTVTVQGSWAWNCPQTSKMVGWAVDWGEPGFTQNPVVGTSATFYMGDAGPYNPNAGATNFDNAQGNHVFSPLDNGDPSNCSGPDAGPWGPLSHTYAAPGSYQICVIIYDIHFSYNFADVKLSGANTKATVADGTSTTITLNNAGDAGVIQDGKIIKVENEEMLVVSGSGSTSLTVVRGYNGTTAVLHNDKQVKIRSTVVDSNHNQLAGGAGHNDDNSVEANFLGKDVQNCQSETIVVGRTLRIEKVTDTTTHPAATFTGTINPGGDDTTFSVGLTANQLAGTPQSRSVSVLAQTVTESSPPTDWTLDGYAVVADSNGTAVCPASGYTGTTATVVADTNNYLVCIKNHYTAPAGNPTVTKAAAATPLPGDGRAHWDITIDNVGANTVAITGITITDAGATLDSTTPASSCSVTPSPFTCNVAANSTTVLHVSKALPAASCTAGSISNSVTDAKMPSGTALSVTNDPNTTITVPATASASCLTVTKDASQTTQTQSLWTITFTNSGPAATVYFTDDASPQTISSVTGSPNSPSCSGSGSTRACTVTVPAGPSGVETITVTTDLPAATCLGTNISNTVAARFGNSEGDTIPTAANGHLTASKTAVNADASLCTQSEVGIDKTHSPAGPFNPGGTFKWKLALTVAGPNTTGATAITDTIPSPFVAEAFGNYTVSAGITCSDGDANTSTVTCSLASGSAAGTYSVEIDISIPANLEVAQCHEYTNTGTIVGPDVVGTPVVGEAPLFTASDNDSVTIQGCAAPSIDIQKTPDSQTIAIGGTASFTITVTNTGNVTLTNVSVSDALAPGCGRTAAQFDALDAGTFDPGDVVSYSCTLTNVQASFTNSATATGTPPVGSDVTDTDTADVVVTTAPSIDIQKTPDTQTVNVGGTATFTITVTNTGNVTLTNVSVSDALAPGCGRTAAQFDLLDPGTFDPGNVVSYNCTLANVQTGFTNSATATGTPPTGSDVSDTDTAVVFVNAPSIDIQKTPDSQTILAGGTATFTITVTNTGDVALTNVFVTDAQAPGCGRTAAQINALDGGTLSVGEVVSYSCTLANVQASFVNSATGTGTPPVGPPVSSTDTAIVTVITIPVIVTVNPTATPTATVVPPTNTPVPPTPVSTTAGARTPGPSPVSTVAGEKTPGPPQTGSGLGSQAGSINASLAVLGLLFLSAGLALVAIGRGKHRA